MISIDFSSRHYSELLKKTTNACSWRRRCLLRLESATSRIQRRLVASTAVSAKHRRLVAGTAVSAKHRRLVASLGQPMWDWQGQGLLLVFRSPVGVVVQVCTDAVQPWRLTAASNNVHARTHAHTTTCSIHPDTILLAVRHMPRLQ